MAIIACSFCGDTEKESISVKHIKGDLAGVWKCFEICTKKGV